MSGRSSPGDWRQYRDSFILDIHTITGTAAIGIVGANVNLMGLVMSGNITIGIDAGQFYIFVPQNDPLTLDFFGVATLKVFGSFNYNETTKRASGTNAFIFSATATITIGEPGVLGVRASLTVTFDSSKGQFVGTVNGDAWIVAIKFSASATLKISGTSISLYLTVSVTIIPGFWVWTPWGGWDYVNPVRASYSHTFNIGSITPAEEFVAPDPDPPVLAHVDNGILYLHMGADAILRDPMGDWDDSDPAESFRVTHVSGVAGDEVVKVDAIGFQKDFSGVSKIVVTDALEGEDVIDIGPGILADAEITGGKGNDRITYFGSGRAILNGGDGNDHLIGGSGGSQANPNELNGGNGDDRLEAVWGSKKS